MSKIDTIISQIAAQRRSENDRRSAYVDELKKKREQEVRRMRDAELNSALFETLSETVEETDSATKKVRVLNFPSKQEINGSVTAIGVENGLNEVKNEVKSLTEVVNTLISCVERLEQVSKDKTVVVSNISETPLVEIPEHPKIQQAKIVALPGYVSEGLDKIAKKLSSLPAPQVTVEAKEVNIESLTSLLGQAASILEQIRDKKDPEEDLTPLVDSMKKVESAINAIQFPIPNFKSSWAHSYTMQSQDNAMSIVYKTVASKKVVDYIETVVGGETYRRTFSYDAEGDTTSATPWSKVS